MIVVFAAAIGVVSQQSEIDDLTSKNKTVTEGKAQAIRQRNATQQDLDAAQQERATAQRELAESMRIKAQRPPGATLFAANCASCHGVDGGGSLGPPQLAGGAVVRRFSEADELA